MELQVAKAIDLFLKNNPPPSDSEALKLMLDPTNLNDQEARQAGLYLLQQDDLRPLIIEIIVEVLNTLNLTPSTPSTPSTFSTHSRSSIFSTLSMILSSLKISNLWRKE